MNSKTIRLAPACIKTLTKVEVDKKSSHQHEFNGVFELRGILVLKKEPFSQNFPYVDRMFLKKLTSLGMKREKIIQYALNTGCILKKIL